METNIFEKIDAKLEQNLGTEKKVVPEAEKQIESAAKVETQEVNTKEKSTEEVRKVSTDIMDFEFKVETQKTIEPEKEITNTQEFFDKLKAKVQMDIKSFDDVVQYVEKGKKLETVEKEFEVASLKTKDYEGLFTNLPQDIMIQIEDFVQGKDYRKRMKEYASLTKDFSKSADTITKEEMIKLYNPDLSDEDLELMEEKTINSFYRTAKELYKKEQELVTKNESNIAGQQDKRVRSFINSIDQNISEIKSKYPSVNQTILNELQETMKKGINTEIFDNEGKYKTNAAETIMFGKYGLKVIEQLKAEFQRELNKKIKEAETNAKLEVLTDNTNSKITPSGHVQQKVTLKEAIKDSLPFLK